MPFANPHFLEIDWAVIKIEGPQSFNLLQGQLTCDVALVTEQRASLAAYCNHQGRVIAVFLLVKKKDDYYCLMPNCIAANFIQTLAKFAVFSKVNVLDVTAEHFIAASLELKPAQTNLYEAIPHDDLILFPLADNICIAWGLLSTHCIEKNSNLWKQALIDAKIPFIYQQTQVTVTPHMLNLPGLGAVSFNKGCFVGQEIIARTHYLGKSKRHLCATCIQDAQPVCPGQSIKAHGQEVGIVIEATSQVRAPILAVLQDSALEQELTCA